MGRLGLCFVATMSVAGTDIRGEEIRLPYAPAEPNFAIPASEGLHSVGVRGFAWVDESRAATARSDTKEYREVAVQVWYPATVDDADRPALYFPDLDEMLMAAESLPAEEQRFVRAHAVLGNTATNSVPGARILESGQRWPVILFSPGGNVSRHAQTALAERMASRGFVFVSMSHPYSTIDVTPRTGFSMSIDWGLDLEDALAANEADNRLADVLAGDAAFALHQLRTLAATDDSLADALNLEDVGILGHSRGGTTVGHACATNPDIVACAVIDNIGPNRERQTGIKQPFMTLRSGWGEERVAELHDYLKRTGSVAYDVELAHSNHFSCTDLPLFISDLRVEGIDPVTGIDACSDILVNFFDAYLKQQTSPPDGPWLPSIRSDDVKITKFRAR
ncbi:MAG: alpha/beta fold hydrolase [Gammaproteobacteria bacterium]|nr:alpha/beta fold hydrolase [Gammaproteobacteria bacterium]MDH4253292.1 alpha/beta fold hydrolase [Gammaproteobacteria bacterium]MDH5310550.1 alpha/beta fold hydrolase [Gammaproteobacteria bacterium]MDH5500198.1 alpha/beta fold hydrolase [Gammaproteobacteria bacterium]